MKFTLKERAQALMRLAEHRPGSEAQDNLFRQAYAQSIAAPILREVRDQSSIMNIYSPVQLEPREQAEFQVEVSALPSTNKFTGAPTSPLLVYQHPGRGPTNGETLFSKTFVVPTGYFEHESGFPVLTAERAQFNFEEAHRRRLANAIINNIETQGWSLIQTTVADAAFPAAQSVEIAVGQPGSKSFSRQLFGKMLKLSLDLGIIQMGQYTATIWYSNQSHEDYTNWDISTQFDTSTPGQIAEDMKSQLSKIAAAANTAVYRGIPMTALRNLDTGDVVASKDYVYLILRSSIPDGLVLPVRLSREYNLQSGLEDYFPMQLMNDPYSVYTDNEIRTKVRWQCGYACVDARVIIIGVVDRS